MKEPSSHKSSDLGPTLLVGGLIAVCCGGPLLLALIAATGVGAVLLSQGAALLALAVLAGAGAAALWLRARGQIRLASGSADCCVPTSTSTQEKP
jgi:hypothetical protein